jgi:hypothetical protein
MKACLLALLFVVALPLNSFAAKATHLKGWYPIISQQNGAPAADEPKTEYFLVDTDTLAVIWDRYAGTALPADLESVKNEIAIITGFTNRDLIFLSLEKVTTVGSNFLAMSGDKKQMELRRRPDGSGSDLATVVEGAISLYRLAPATATPTNGLSHAQILVNY